MLGGNKLACVYLLLHHVKKYYKRGTWVPQSIKHPILDFGSGHDLRVVRWSPALGSALSVEPA